ncbi:MAG: hypothetical protein HQK49_16925 [Oligoflexia bacterium]|nr:hypothetical protein [Oligoflexia bacterium]
MTMTNQKKMVEMIFKEGPMIRGDVNGSLEDFSIKIVELSRTKSVLEYSDQVIRNFLFKFYNLNGNYKYLATIFNAIISDNKYTFLLNHQVMLKLLSTDQNVENNDKMSKEHFELFIQKAISSKVLKMLREVNLNDKEYYLLEIVQHDLLDYLLKKFGKDSIEQQKYYVLQYLAYKKRELLSGEEEEFYKNYQDYTIKEARKKAISLGLISTMDENNKVDLNVEAKVEPNVEPKAEYKEPLKEQLNKLRDQLLQAELSFLQEQKRYSVLLDEAKKEEALRLENDTDYELTQRAIMAGIRCKKQKNLVEDLELNFLRLRDQYNLLHNDYKKSRTVQATTKKEIQLNL